MSVCQRDFVQRVRAVLSTATLTPVLSTDIPNLCVATHVACGARCQLAGHRRDAARSDADIGALGGHACASVHLGVPALAGRPEAHGKVRS